MSKADEQGKLAAEINWFLTGVIEDVRKIAGTPAGCADVRDFLRERMARADALVTENAKLRADFAKLMEHRNAMAARSNALREALAAENERLRGALEDIADGHSLNPRATARAALAGKGE